MSKELCEAINEIDKLFKVEKNDLGSFIKYDDSLKAYCPTPNHLNKQECTYYEQVVASAFIALLTLFKNFDDDGDEDVLEDNKLAEYAILWLCYKINQEKHNLNNLNEFYNKYIMNNEKNIKESNGADAYNSYKDIINKKQDMMNMGISDASKLYEPFKSLCDMYTAFDAKNNNCTKCSKHAEDFVNEFKKLNDDSNHIEGSSHSQILSTLSNDYDKLKKKCGNGQSNNFPSPPPINPKKSSTRKFIEASGHISGHRSGQNYNITPSNSSIASKLVPGLLIFAIPIFLGVAYKYSLFGIEKRLQRKYLREKLIKIKKKMNINI
ncbi:Plasmodium variant antigen protein Cir/Yir/Bir, putative [Plasmodium chabaudi adami]|uniref:Plasmodium variant antigen protein Cir/Yir/Bir, putative n=1 Tax=Plasmodium chabaudi adami TaxID=5826 RepID=A0A1C6WXS7_PLACE|nr:Plasmodium variant antigen protein Cir/Yir/Bir, putative [Plasmodium chabaudi adami]